MTVAAIIPARGGSVRLPRKNLLPFAGRPLIAHKIHQLRECPMVSTVYVNTDDPEILHEAKKAGAVALQGKDYHGNQNDMLRDSANQVTEDLVLWAHCTNPLVKPATYSAAINAYRLRSGVHDSLVSVYPMHRHAWWQGRPLNHEPWSGRHQIGADLGAVYFQCGSIFIQPRAQMVENASFYGASPYLFVMDAAEATDIDYPHDLKVARALWAS